MAEAIVAFGVEEIVKKVISLVAGRITQAWGFKNELTKLQDSLTIVQAVLQDAGERQVTDKAVGIWLQRLRDVAYDAEDLLEDLDYELLRRKIEIQNQLQKVSNFFSVSNPLAFRFKMANRVKRINKSLEKVKSDATGLMLRERIGSIDVYESRIVETDSFLDELEVVGRDEEISKIVTMLVNSSDGANTSVIPIVGMPGLGKTTLARMLCKQIEEKKLFDVTMWVCVSNRFDEGLILGGMLESINENAGGIRSIDAILRHLRENLKDKSFFLVLDDVWNQGSMEWDSLKSRLLKISENKVNCIVVTTRSEQVASIVESVPMRRHYPTKLSDEECWLIIKDKAFGKAFGGVPSDLEDIGRGIAKKCGGLPLLAKVLGGTMRFKKSRDEWLLIKDSNLWNLVGENDGVLPVLKLSFDRLPSSALKQCFAYCAIFPEDYVIKKTRLIQLWIAAGYVQPNQESCLSAEDVGHDYFKILLANSLFQDVEKNEQGNIISCKMHDAVHELTEFVSKSEIWTSEGSLVKNISNIRHVSLTRDGEILKTLGDVGCQKLHSLFTRVDVCGNNSVSLKSLRVLDLHDSDTKELSISSRKLKHLRYLDISKTRVSVLPRSLTRLYNLQTLRLQSCLRLKKSLRGIKNLVNLKHIMFSNPELMPSHIGNLTCLQTLPMFVVGREKGYQIKELGSLNQLSRKLHILKLEHVRDKFNAMEANLIRKSKLHGLVYEWSFYREGIINDEEVLAGLQPHANLAELEILNFHGVKFPLWFTDPLMLGCLVKLILFECLNCEELPTLGLLPALTFLDIIDIPGLTRIGGEFYTNLDQTSTSSGNSRMVTIFKSLKKLKLSRMRSLKEWVVPEPRESMIVFPCLEELTVEHSPLLSRLPVSQLLSLKKLYIENCDGLSDLGHIIMSYSSSIKDLTIYKCPKLILTPPRLIACLKNLDIRDCQSLTAVPVSQLPSLELLNFERCEALTDFEDGSTEVANCMIPNMCGLKSLVVLKIERCNMTCLPNGLQFCEYLRKININCCPNLTSVPEYIGELTSLVSLIIYKCESLKSLPSRLCSNKSIEELHIALCHSLENVPYNIGEMFSLEKLIIVGCSKLSHLPRGSLSGLTRLKTLHIGKFSHELVEFRCFDLTQSPNPSVEGLMLHGWDRLKMVPEQFQHLTSLKGLYIGSFDQIEVLPEWLGNLSSLQTLRIGFCKNLRNLPDAMTQLTNLEELEISHCPLIAAMLSGIENSESLKVSHIPTITIYPRSFLT